MLKGKYKRSKKQIERLKKMALMPRTLRGGGYSAVHKWLNRHYGVANKCENPHCQSTKKYKSYQYALIKGKKYEHKRENFLMLCPKCHFAYDDTKERREKQSQTLRGRKLTEKHKIAISEGMKGKNIGNKNSIVRVNQYDLKNNLIKSWESLSEAATIIGISKGGISMCCRGKLKKSGGFIWKYQNSV